MKRVLALAVFATLLAATPVGSHPERPTSFPKWTGLKLPKYRTTGPAHVVCARDSRARLKKAFPGRKNRKVLKKRLALLKKCRFREIQPAIDKARSGYRILIMPGVYTEPSARKVPFGRYQQEPCADDYVETEGFTDAPPPAGPASNDPPVRPNRNFQVKCPNSHNLVAVIGDDAIESDPSSPSDVVCRRLCDLQIEGMGAKATDVVLVGDRMKMDVLRAERVTGLYIRRITVEQAAFNGIDIVESNGAVVKDVEARYNQNYGVLAFASTNVLFDRIDAHHNGDSGVYPGSNQKGCDLPDYDAYGTCAQTGCQRYTTEIRHVNSHHNVMGYSGTAGNSTWVHDSEFHHNSAGLFTDSFASGHPGMPQECFKWERNRIHSNNENYFSAENQDKCVKLPDFAKRPREWVCPQFQVPVGVGVGIAGGSRDILRDNWVYDNWRYGVMLFYVPATLRDENEPDRQQDTSNGNQFVGNRMGVRPDGTRDPNGLDFWWDEQGVGNCWSGNVGPGGGATTADPMVLPGCPGGSNSTMPNPNKSAGLVPCSAWDPLENPRPVACTWFDTPPEP